MALVGKPDLDLADRDAAFQEFADFLDAQLDLIGVRRKAEMAGERPEEMKPAQACNPGQLVQWNFVGKMLVQELPGAPKSSRRRAGDRLQSTFAEFPQKQVERARQQGLAGQKRRLADNGSMKCGKSLKKGRDGGLGYLKVRVRPGLGFAGAGFD